MKATALGCVLCIFSVAASSALAQNYPVRPIRVIAPFPPGGGTDLFARTIAQKLSAAWGQQVVVDNRSGAGGMIGSEMVAKAAPDGYTLLITSSSSHVISPHLSRKPPYDALNDFVPVIMIASAPNVLVVHPSVPARSVKELIDLAKARPGALNYASNGSGTLSHLTGELFKLQTGVDLVHIPYKGGPPAVIDLVAGQVSVLFSALPTVFAQVRAGKLRLVAVTGDKRIAPVIDVPTVAETVPGFESVQWWGMFAPPALSAELSVRLSSEVSKMLVDPELKARFAAEGAESSQISPRDFPAFLKADFEKWGKVVKAAGIRPE
ncbi:MAG: tripartite tricarboxylate transporter substrate binding protein [Betaproteobacteria bacterium]|nr:tripartite tricarboxylate transporter substrate binding protein [Betaproteobacteria bacterium]